MTLDVTLDTDAEEITMVIDNCQVIKASKNYKSGGIKLCESFRELEDSDEKLFKILQQFTSKLLYMDE